MHEINVDLIVDSLNPNQEDFVKVISLTSLYLV